MKNKVGIILKLFLTEKDKEEKSHSPFSASGAERWFHCPGSVKLTEGIPNKETPWSAEGTLAHAVLEKVLKEAIAGKADYIKEVSFSSQPYIPKEMVEYARVAANFILQIYRESLDAEIFVEDRVYLSHIHPDMFGTLDSSIINFFDTLHVFDYKYGAGHAVGPEENLQMIFYAMAKGKEFNWNFSRARLWIIQPRVKGYDGPLHWDISTPDLMRKQQDFLSASQRALKNPDKYVKGSWCHWCKGKGICPEQVEKRAQDIFKPLTQKGETNGKKESEKEKTNIKKETFF